MHKWYGEVEIDPMKFYREHYTEALDPKVLDYKLPEFKWEDLQKDLEKYGTRSTHVAIAPGFEWIDTELDIQEQMDWFNSLDHETKTLITLMNDMGRAIRKPVMNCTAPMEPLLQHLPLKEFPPKKES